MDSPLPEEVTQLIVRLVSESLQGQQAQLSTPDLSSHIPGLIEEVTARVMGEYGENLIREQIASVCRSLHAQGCFAGTSGNISVRLQGGDILITASGLNKGQITAGDIIKVTPSGQKISGPGEPSSEIKMHLFSYEKRKDIGAIVHAHPPFATGFATAGIPLDRPVLPEAILVLGSIPLVGYGTPSTWEVPRALEPHIQKHHAFLLSNHGTLTFGKDLFQASHRTETLELFAKIILIARMLGGEKLLTREHLEKLSKAR